jgi:hypothetical protein
MVIHGILRSVLSEHLTRPRSSTLWLALAFACAAVLFFAAIRPLPKEWDVEEAEMTLAKPIPVLSLTQVDPISRPAKASTLAATKVEKAQPKSEPKENMAPTQTVAKAAVAAPAQDETEPPEAPPAPRPSSRPSSEQAVTVSFTYESEDMEPLYDLEEKLEGVIAKSRVGKYEGSDVGGESNQVFMYFFGPNADRLFETVRPLLTRSPFLKGADVTLQYGHAEDGAKEKKVTLPK